MGFLSVHFPPVEIEKFRSFAASEHKVKIRRARYSRKRQLCRDRLPIFPASGGRHLKTSQELSLDAIKANLNLTAPKSTGHTRRKDLGLTADKVHVLQFDIVTIVNVRHIDAYLPVLFGLHSFRESHGFSLRLTERLEGGDRFHSLVGGLHHGERAISVVLKRLDSHTASEASSMRKFSRVIEEITMSLIVSHTRMIGERFRVRLRHNYPGIRPRSGRRRSRAVRDMFRNAAGRINQL